MNKLSAKKGFEIRKILTQDIKSKISAKLSLTFENYSKLYKLSEQMTTFMGKSISTKREITKKIWEHIKQFDLLQESHFIIDNKLSPLFCDFIDKYFQQEEKVESEFKINLFQLKSELVQKPIAPVPKPKPSEIKKLPLFYLNDAICEHIISIASFEFLFEIPPPPSIPSSEAPDALEKSENMDDFWTVYDVLVKLQEENINEAMPFFVQKVYFEEKEREKILKEEQKNNFNEVMIQNEKIKLENQKILEMGKNLQQEFFIKRQYQKVCR